MKKQLFVQRAVAVCTAFLIVGCGGGSSLGTSAPPMSAEAVCATIPSTGYGNAFYCATSQANLQNPGGFPDGSLGYCMFAGENLGLVGYSVTTYSGGAYLVSTQSEASALSQALGSQSPGYSRCTRQ